MIEWNAETISCFVGGCCLGASVSFLVTYFVVTYMAEKKYNTLRLECNSLVRKNYKLIRFIKERRWE